MPNDLTPQRSDFTRIVVPDTYAFFTSLGPTAQALIFAAGTYRTAPLFTQNGVLFAKYGSGFVKLRSHGETSRPKTFWKELHGIQDWIETFEGLTFKGTKQ